MSAKKRWVRQLPKNTVEVNNLDKIIEASHGNKRKFLVVIIGSTKRVADLIRNKLGTRTLYGHYPDGGNALIS